MYTLVRTVAEPRKPREGRPVDNVRSTASIVDFTFSNYFTTLSDKCRHHGYYGLLT